MTTTATSGPSTALTTASLLDLLRHHAQDPTLADRLDPTCPDRQWARVAAEQGAELWLISWPVFSSTGWHDHGSARGAFTTLRGRLTEYTWSGAVHARTLPTGGGRAFGSSHVHDVANEASGPALSLHVYAPRLSTMTRYELVGGRLEAVGVDRAGAW